MHDLPGATLTERDVARDSADAEELDIVHTPTVIVRGEDGNDVFRASGGSAVPQVLAAAARALPTTTSDHDST
jgi:hypothetical protein